WTVTHVAPDGGLARLGARHVISSAPMRSLVRGLSPHVSGTALAAANSLKYRDFLTVVLIVRDRDRFSDNWIYIHDPSGLVGRMQNFKAWSSEMVADASLNCYGLEYFCFEGDGLWNSSDEQLIERAKSEIAKIGLASPMDVVDGC